MFEKKKATCPFCSLHCSDLLLSFDGIHLVDISPSCTLGEAGFRHATTSYSKGITPEYFHGKTLRTAREWLQKARQPLVVLSGKMECGAIMAAVRLAEQYSAILVCDEDYTGSTFGLALQDAGILTCTLGEMNALSPIILCGVDPGLTHPRLSDYLDAQLDARTLHFDFHGPLEDLRWLRLSGSDTKESIPANYTEFVSLLETCSTGLVVFGSDWMKKGQPFATELLLWIKELNQKNPWYALYLTPAPNSTGVVEVLLSETGYPGNIRFDPGGVNFSPRLWKADRIIQQGAADVCLLVGQPCSFSETTLAVLSQSRTILIDPDHPGWDPQLWIKSATEGVDSSGRMQRLDGVPVDLSAILPIQGSSTRDVLLELIHEDYLT